MTTVNAANPAPIVPPPTLATAATAGNTASAVTVWFRQSADGVNFTVTPVYMNPLDAAYAVNHAPAEYSRDGVTWAAAWATNNTAQTPGGLGRLAGAHRAAG